MNTWEIFDMKKMRRDFLNFKFLFLNSHSGEFAVEEVETRKLVTDGLKTDELNIEELSSGGISDPCTVGADVLAIASLCWPSFGSAAVTAVLFFSFFSGTKFYELKVLFALHSTTVSKKMLMSSSSTSRISISSNVAPSFTIFDKKFLFSTTNFL